MKESYYNKEERQFGMADIKIPGNELLQKYDELQKYIKSLESVAVAFSSGVDSTFLLYAAIEALGDKVIAVTASSESFPERELKESIDYCGQRGVKHVVFNSAELSIEGFSHNPPNRCYLCKREIFTKILEIAQDEGMKEVVEGSNLDDNGDYRPGLVAVKELGIKSPLRHIGFTKDEIRSLSKHFNLPTYKKPSFACLASRFVYGETISEEKLRMVDKAEQLLIDLGFEQVRVRIHNNIARIEILPEEFDKLMVNSIRQKVVENLKQFGFDYVTMDLIGYRTGSMNEVINK